MTLRLLVLLLLALPLHAELTRWFTGSTDDVQPRRLHGPVLMLVGGGGDQSEAMQASIDAVRGCGSCDVKVDVVVIRASGADGYNAYFLALDGVSSVISMIITDRESASRPDVVQIVRDAELVFFAGGDQCNYIRWIKGTPVEMAVENVFRRRGAIGGTSAGLAIQGEITYDACAGDSAKSAVVMADPFHKDVSLSRDFFDWPVMRNFLTDTHFQQRDRLGRLLVFLSRTLAEGKEKRVIGLGVSEGTALIVGPTGIGRVMGEGPVHFVLADSPAQTLERGKPLTHRGFRIWRLNKGESVDLKRLQSTEGKLIDVIEGKLTADPY